MPLSKSSGFCSKLRYCSGSDSVSVRYTLFSYSPFFMIAIWSAWIFSALDLPFEISPHRYCCKATELWRHKTLDAMVVFRHRSLLVHMQLVVSQTSMCNLATPSRVSRWLNVCHGGSIADAIMVTLNFSSARYLVEVRRVLIGQYANTVTSSSRPRDVITYSVPVFGEGGTLFAVVGRDPGDSFSNIYYHLPGQQHLERTGPLHTASGFPSQVSRHFSVTSPMAGAGSASFTCLWMLIKTAARVDGVLGYHKENRHS